MADEQLETSSAEPQASDASASEPSSAEPEQKTSSSPSWWQRMFHRRGDPEPDATDEDSTIESAPSRLTLTQEELDRRVQAETDRREAKRAAEARARERRELRDKDPWAYAEQERKEEETNRGTQDLHQFVVNVGTEHDRVSIDPIFLKLPKAEQERIKNLEGAGTGLPGRKLVVEESLKVLEKHWRAEGAKDAEKRLRSNQAFRKQILAENRGSTQEPELLPSVGGASEADKTVSALLRSHYRLG